MIINLATKLPAKVRAWVYGILGVIAAAQGAFHFIPDGTWGKVMTFLGALGLGMASINAGVTVSNGTGLGTPGIETGFLVDGNGVLAAGANPAPAAGAGIAPDPADFPLADPGTPLPE